MPLPMQLLIVTPHCLVHPRRDQLPRRRTAKFLRKRDAWVMFFKGGITPPLFFVKIFHDDETMRFSTAFSTF